MKNDGHHPNADRVAAIEPFLGDRTFDALWEDFERDGYVVFHNVIGNDEIARVRDALRPHFAKNAVGGMISKDLKATANMHF